MRRKYTAAQLGSVLFLLHHACFSGITVFHNFLFSLVLETITIFSHVNEKTKCSNDVTGNATSWVRWMKTFPHESQLSSFCQKKTPEIIFTFFFNYYYYENKLVISVFFLSVRILKLNYFSDEQFLMFNCRWLCWMWTSVDHRYPE